MVAHDPRNNRPAFRDASIQEKEYTQMQLKTAFKIAFKFGRLTGDGGPWEDALLKQHNSAALDAEAERAFTYITNGGK
jgi:hypothetical protein